MLYTTSRVEGSSLHTVLHALRSDLEMAVGRSENVLCDCCAGMAGSDTAPRSL